MFEIASDNVLFIGSVYGLGGTSEFFGDSVSLARSDGLLAVATQRYGSSLGALYTFRVNFLVCARVCVCVFVRVCV